MFLSINAKPKTFEFIELLQSSRIIFLYVRDNTTKETEVYTCYSNSPYYSTLYAFFVANTSNQEDILRELNIVCKNQLNVHLVHNPMLNIHIDGKLKIVKTIELKPFSQAIFLYVLGDHNREEIYK